MPLLIQEHHSISALLCLKTRDLFAVSISKSSLACTLAQLHCCLHSFTFLQRRALHCSSLHCPSLHCFTLHCLTVWRVCGVYRCSVLTAISYFLMYCLTLYLQYTSNATPALETDSYLSYVTRKTVRKTLHVT